MHLSEQKNVFFGFLLVALVCATYIHRSYNGNDDSHSTRLLTQQQVDQYCDNSSNFRVNYTDSQKSELRRVFNLVSSTRASRLSLIELTQQDDADFHNWFLGYFNYAVVWIVFLVLTFIIWVFLIIFCSCKVCKRCHRLRKKKCWCCFQSKNRKYIRWQMGVVLVAAFGIISASVAGFGTMEHVQTGYKHTACSAVGGLDVFNFGDSMSKWAGLSPLANNILQTFRLIAVASDSTAIGFGDNSTLIVDNVTFADKIDALYTTWSTTQIRDANPWNAEQVTPDIISVINL